MTGYVQPIAQWQVTLDGKDLTDIMDPLLISLCVTEKRDQAADQLDIVLADKDGTLEIPKEGAKLKVAMGWKQGSGLPIGLIDKGTFKVDEVSFRGPPDQITIRARSADFSDAFRVRKERSFIGKTVSEIVGKIASDNGLEAKIDATLGAKTIPAIGPGAKSDGALLAQLGRRFDAVATVKEGTLIFAPVGKGHTAGGKALPTFEIDRGETSEMTYQRVTRDKYNGVTASWHDMGEGHRHSLKSADHVEGATGKAKHLRKVFANETDARHAAEAEASRLRRLVATGSMRLALGRPEIFPEIPVKLTGFKAEMNAAKWLVAGATHRMDGSGGLVTDLDLEAQK